MGRCVGTLAMQSKKAGEWCMFLPKAVWQYARPLKQGQGSPASFTLQRCSCGTQTPQPTHVGEREQTFTWLTLA